MITIWKEKDKYEQMKDNLRSKNEKYEIMRLSSVKSDLKKKERKNKKKNRNKKQQKKIKINQK